MLQSVPTLLTDVEAHILKHEDSLVVTQYKDLFEEEKKIGQGEKRVTYDHC